MNKSNSIMEKIQEYQTPSTIVVELQNEGAILVGSGDTQNVSSTSTLVDYGQGSLWGGSSN